MIKTPINNVTPPIITKYVHTGKLFVGWGSGIIGSTTLTIILDNALIVSFSLYVAITLNSYFSIVTAFVLFTYISPFVLIMIQLEATIPSRFWIVHLIDKLASNGLIVTWPLTSVLILFVILCILPNDNSMISVSFNVLF